RARRETLAARAQRHRAAAPRSAAAVTVQRSAAARQGRRIGCRSPPRRAPARPVKFWDASAIVPLLIAEAPTRRLQALAAGDPDILVWWGSPVECVSALARLDRDAA